jgi:hypothetical protein
MINNSSEWVVGWGKGETEKIPRIRGLAKKS